MRNIKRIHEETRARLKEILTPEQMKKMDEMKKRHHEQWKKQERNRKTGLMPARIL